jgi:hypothetical protein
MDANDLAIEAQRREAQQLCFVRVLPSQCPVVTCCTRTASGNSTIFEIFISYYPRKGSNATNVPDAPQAAARPEGPRDCTKGDQ